MDNQASHKIIDRTASIFLILFIVSLLFALSKSFGRFFYREEFLQVSTQMSFVSLIYIIFGHVINIGAAVWLFIEAKKTDSSKGLWATLGLFGGLIAVVLWYLRKIFHVLDEAQKQAGIKKTATPQGK